MRQLAKKWFKHMLKLKRCKLKTEYHYVYHNYHNLKNNIKASKDTEKLPLTYFCWKHKMVVTLAKSLEVSLNPGHAFTIATSKFTPEHLSQK